MTEDNESKNSIISTKFIGLVAVNKLIQIANKLLAGNNNNVKIKGHLKWKFKTDERIITIPFINNGLIYFGNHRQD